MDTPVWDSILQAQLDYADAAGGQLSEMTLPPAEFDALIGEIARSGLSAPRSEWERSMYPEWVIIVAGIKIHRGPRDVATP